MKKNFNKFSTLNSQLSIRRGFTLIELLVVISIIAILTSLLVANFVGVRQRGRDAQRKSDLKQIQSALEMYRSDKGYYPVSSALVNCGPTVKFQDGTTVYMQKVPCDPSSSTTKYTYTAQPLSPVCNNLSTGTYCTSYTIFTCLENKNDQDPNASGDCTPPGGSTNSGKGYSLTSP